MFCHFRAGLCQWLPWIRTQRCDSEQFYILDSRSQKTVLFSICNTFGAKTQVRMALPFSLHVVQLWQKDAG